MSTLFRLLVDFIMIKQYNKKELPTAVIDSEELLTVENSGLCLLHLDCGSSGF